MEDIILLGPEKNEYKIQKYKLLNFSDYFINMLKYEDQKTIDLNNIPNITKTNFIAFCNLINLNEVINNEMLSDFIKSYKLIDFTCSTKIVNTSLMYFTIKHTCKINDLKLFICFVELNHLIDNCLKRTYEKLLKYYIPRIAHMYSSKRNIDDVLKIHVTLKNEILKFTILNFDAEDDIYFSGNDDDDEDNEDNINFNND